MKKFSGIRCHLNYMGGKYHLAKWIISNFPEHSIYVEPFGGVAHVLVQKYPSKLEVYNDINIDVVNLFRVLQNKTKREELIGLLQFTPYSRKWLDDIRDGEYKIPTEDEEVRKAYRFLILTRLSFASNIYKHKPTWGYNLKKDKMIMSFVNFTDKYIYEIIERFKMVQIDMLDFRKVIEKYDSSDTLFYCDPPYWGCEYYYKGEFSKQDHIDLARMLNNIKGKACVSYYDFPELKELYPLSKWRIEKRGTFKHSEKVIGNKRQKSEELLLMNYEKEG